MKKTQSNVMNLALGGMMGALIFVATYLIKLPVSITQGYIHLGDGFILLGAALLGPIAIPAAAIGSMLADLLGGYTLYCLPTFLIKGAVAAVAAWAFARFRAMPLRIVWMIIAEAVMVVGYFLVEWLVLGYGLAAALYGSPLRLQRGGRLSQPRLRATGDRPAENRPRRGGVPRRRSPQRQRAMGDHSALCVGGIGPVWNRRRRCRRRLAGRADQGHQHLHRMHWIGVRVCKKSKRFSKSIGPPGVNGCNCILRCCSTPT